MKRIGQVLMLATLAATGCLPVSFLQGEKKPPAVQMQPSAPPAVTADTIREDNADASAQALRAELEHELHHKADAGPPQ